VFEEPNFSNQNNVNKEIDLKPEAIKGTLTVNSPLPDVETNKKRRNTFNKAPRPAIEVQKIASASP
jgi:hypothetical protein